MKHFLLLSILMLSSILSFAYDFEAVNSDGVSIFYSISSASEPRAWVTYKNSTTKYAGDIVIPSVVSYEGVEYLVTGIGYDAFNDCSGLTSLTIPSSVMTIYTTFKNCTSLKSLKIYAHVSSLSDGMLSGCSNLENLTIPFVGNNGVSKYGSKQKTLGFIFGTDWYSGAKSTSQSYYRYDANMYLDYYIPSTLRSVIVLGGEIGLSSFENCSMLTSVTLPEGLESIGDYAFYGCTGIKSITLPTSLKTIGESSFRFTGLSAIEIPNSVQSIGNNAFRQSEGLTSIEIPNSVISIGDFAFYYCEGLADLYCHASNIPTTGSSVFNCSNQKNATLHVPFASVSAYKAANQWKDFGSIVSIVEVAHTVTFVIDGKVYSTSSLSEGADIVLPDYTPSAGYKITWDDYPTVMGKTNITVTGTTSKIFNGSGTAEDPYQITSAEDLQNISNAQGGYFKQMNDIELTSWIEKNSPETGWVPINADGQQSSICCTNYDGNNKKITGLWIDSDKDVALFYRGLQNIENLTVEIASNTAVKTTGDYVAAICASEVTSATNVHVTGNIVGNASSKNNWASGLFSVVKACANCTYSGTISGYFVSGIAKRSGNTTNCATTGTFTGQNVGGIIYEDYSYNHTVENCYSNAQISGTAIAGGIVGVGNSFPSMSIRNCYFSGALSAPVSSYSQYNGIAGRVDPQSTGLLVYNCVAISSEPTEANAGKIISWSKLGYSETEDDDCVIIPDASHNKVLSLAEVKSASTYSGLGWDMSNVWAVSEGSSYPYLKNLARNFVEIEQVKYTLTYKVDGVVYKTESYGEGETILAIPEPTKEGYTFSGWSEIPSTMPADNVVVEGNFTEDNTPGVVEPSTDISSMSNVVYIKDIETTTGATIQLPISLKNAKEDIVGFQFDLYVPEGVNLSRNSRGKLQAPVFNAESDRTSSDYHTVSASEIEGDANGGVKVLCYSNDNEVFIGTNGVVCDLTATLAENFEPGEYNIILKNVVITNKELVQTKIAKVVSKLTIPSYTLGDVNGDAEVNVTDIAATASYILGTTPTTFIFKASDINCDDEINVTDIAGIASIILTGKTASAKGRDIIDYGYEASLDIMPTIKDNESGVSLLQLGVNSSKANVVAGFQCDVVLPEGFTWMANNRGKLAAPSFNQEYARTTSACHVASASQKENGAVRMLCYSANNEGIKGTEGVVLDLPISLSSNVAPGQYEVTLENIVITDGMMNQKKAPSCTFVVNVDGATSIESIENANDNLDIYDLSGRKYSSVKKLSNGVYIINGKKYIKK